MKMNYNIRTFKQAILVRHKYRNYRTTTSLENADEIKTHYVKDTLIDSKILYLTIKETY